MERIQGRLIDLQDVQLVLVPVDETCVVEVMEKKAGVLNVVLYLVITVENPEEVPGILQAKKQRVLGA